MRINNDNITYSHVFSNIDLLKISADSRLSQIIFWTAICHKKSIENEFGSSSYYVLRAFFMWRSLRQTSDWYTFMAAMDVLTWGPRRWPLQMTSFHSNSTTSLRQVWKFNFLRGIISRAKPISLHVLQLRTETTPRCFRVQPINPDTECGGILGQASHASLRADTWCPKKNCCCSRKRHCLFWLIEVKNSAYASSTKRRVVDSLYVLGTQSIYFFNQP